MEYRKLKYSEIDDYVEIRIEFVTLIRHVKNINLFKENTKEYIKNHFNSDDLIIYVAVDNKHIVSSCMLCSYEMIPLPTSNSRKIGELLNVYTKKEYRRQGHSAKLIKLLMDEAKEKDVSKIILEYTEDGYPLYKHLGFKKIENTMEYRL